MITTPKFGVWVRVRVRVRVRVSSGVWVSVFADFSSQF
jgi:hypothetical protein